LQASKKLFGFLVAFSILLSVSACSQEGATKSIKVTLFLLDASKSMILSIPQREQQLKERLAGAFDEDPEAIYFDFIRNDYTKQVILPLVSMQSIINVNDQIINYAKDKKVRSETSKLVSDLWRKSISDAKTVEACINDGTKELDINTVLEQGARIVAQNICVSAGKAKETLANIRLIGSGGGIENGFIGSDIEGAFIRGLKRLESESGNLYNKENERVGVRATIVVSSDMMQRRGDGQRVLDSIKDMNEEQLTEFVTKSRGQQEFRELRPVVKIDGWLSTKKNFSEKDRQTLELYWKKWFTSFDLDEPDFGFGVMDWSVDQ
jgi:hypothetical protein